MKLPIASRSPQPALFKSHMKAPQYEQIVPHIPPGIEFTAEDINTRAHMTIARARSALYHLANLGRIEKMPRRSGEALRYKAKT